MPNNSPVPKGAIGDGLVKGISNNGLSLIENGIKWLWDASVRFALSQCSRSVRVLYKSAVYHDIVEWVVRHETSKKCTSFGVFQGAGGGAFNLTPYAPNRLMRHKGRLLLIQFGGGLFRKSDAPESGDSNTTPTPDNDMYIPSDGGGGTGVTLTLFGAKSPDELTELLDTIASDAALYRKGRTTHSVYQSRGARWSHLYEKPLRSADSVILPDGCTMGDLIADVRKFLDDKEWYAKMGIPHRRGWMFDGLPGTGKSSAIAAIAAALGMNLCVLRLGAADMSDENLTQLLMNVPTDSVVLLEDLDAAFSDPQDLKGFVGGIVSRADATSADHIDAARTARRMNTKSETPLTFSGLLNALDGPLAPEGQLRFYTTNHIERLDKALIRPGRVDMRVTFGHATKKQIALFYERFYPLSPIEHVDTFATEIEERQVTMAEVQEYLLRHRESETDGYLNRADLKPREGGDTMPDERREHLLSIQVREQVANTLYDKKGVSVAVSCKGDNSAVCDGGEIGFSGGDGYGSQVPY